MKNVMILFYPLMRGDNDELVINFDELLIQELYFDSKKTNEEIENHINLIRSFDIIHIDSWRIMNQ